MIHAEPGIGVREMGFSLVTLKKPVFFGHPENDPVDIVLCVAAVHRQEMNEEAIVSIMALLEEETLLEELRKATSLDTFWEYWQNILA